MRIASSAADDRAQGRDGDDHTAGAPRAADDSVAGGLGGCGSVIQGSTYDDGGASPDECRKKRHHETVMALELFVIAVAAGGTGVGLAVHNARSRRRDRTT